MPKITFKSRDEIPEGLREHAKEEGGAFSVDVAPASKVAEFRDNNVALARERDDLKVRVESLASIVGSDPEKFQTELKDLRSTAQKVKDGSLKGTDAVEAEVTRRIDSVKTNYEGQLADLGKKLAAAEEKSADLNAKYSRSIVDREVTNAAVAKDSGVNPTALPDILTRAYGLFSVQPDGKLIPKSGDAVVYGSDGVTPLTPREWLKKLLVEAPHFAQNSSGGGAPGNGGTNPHGMSSEALAKLTPAQKIALGIKAQRA